MIGARYVFRNVPLCIRNAKKADPQKIGEAIAKAKQETGAGQDIRERLVESARNKRHALHRHLEWDDSVAAHKYRLEQVNDLIRVIAVENEETGDPEPAFIKLIPSRGGGAFYTPGELRSSADLQEAALTAADRDLAAFQRRHRVLSDICAIVGAAREKIRERLDKAESRAAA